MRLDEHGRWVSDDGAYVWDESAQTWQPTTSRPGGSTPAGPTGPSAARGGGGTGAYGAGAGSTGHRPAQAEAGGYGRPNPGQQAYDEPRTGSFPLFGGDPRGRDREASWAPATGPYPQPSRTGSADPGASGPGRTGSGYGADPATGATPLNTGADWRAGAAPTRGGADRGQTGSRPAAPGTGQSRSWSARDPLGTGPYNRSDPLGGGQDRAEPLSTGPYDRSDPLGATGPTRGGYDRADPLSGPFNRADPLGTGASTGTWTRGGTGPGQSRGAGTGPTQSRAGSGGTGPNGARGGGLDGLGDGPGTMNRPGTPLAGGDSTGPLPTDVVARGGSGRFSTASFGKAGAGTGPRAARPGGDLDDDLGRDLDDLLVDDQDDEDDEDEDRPTGARGRLRGLGRLGGADQGRLDQGRLGADDEDDDDLDEDDEPGGRGSAAGALLGKVRASRGRMLAAGAAVLVVVVVAVVLVLKTTGANSSSGGGTTTAGGTAAATGRQYDASIRKVYLDQCVAQSNGAQAYCNCTLQKLEAGYSQEDFLRINADPTSATGQRVVKEIRDACKSLR